VNAPGTVHPLPELLERLKSAGFAVSTGEALDAARLLARLAERDTEALELESLRQHLHPLLCKVSDVEARQRFDSIFQDWWNRTGVVEPSGPKPPIVGGVPPEPAITPRRSRCHLALLWVCLLLAIVFAAWQRLPEREPKLELVQPLGDTKPRQEPVSPPPTPPAEKPKQGPRIYGYWPAYRYTEILRPAIAWVLVGVPFS